MPTFTIEGSHDRGHPVLQSLPPLRCLSQTSNSRHSLQLAAMACHKAPTNEGLVVRNQKAMDFPITSSSTPAFLAIVVVQLRQPWLPSLSFAALESFVPHRHCLDKLERLSCFATAGLRSFGYLDRSGAFPVAVSYHIRYALIMTVTVIIRRSCIEFKHALINASSRVEFDPDHLRVESKTITLEVGEVQAEP